MQLAIHPSSYQGNIARVIADADQSRAAAAEAKEFFTLWEEHYKRFSKFFKTAVTFWILFLLGSFAAWDFIKSSQGLLMGRFALSLIFAGTVICLSFYTAYKGGKLRKSYYKAFARYETCPLLLWSSAGYLLCAEEEWDSSDYRVSVINRNNPDEKYYLGKVKSLDSLKVQ